MRRLLLLLSILLTWASCTFNDVTGSGNIETEVRKPGAFRALKVSNGMDVKVKAAAENRIEVKADDNVLEYVQTSVEKGKLIIRYESNTSISDAEVLVTVYTSTPLELIDASSAGSILVYGDGAISEEKVELEASSSAIIKAPINTQKVTASASSAGSITLKGSAEKLSADASSSGEIKGTEFSVQHAELNASSGSEIKHISVVQTLDADASSGATITYSGDAVKSKINNSSGGSVERE